MPSATELQATNNQILANLSTPQNDSMQQTLANIAQSSTIQQSALGAYDRMRYSFADTWGKKRIIEQAGYNPDNIVPLPNGEFGVRTAQGIKPIDPKGFQMKDLGGDIMDMAGKSLPTLGAVAGGLLGAAPGAMAGGAGGELARQGLGDLMGVRQKGLQLGDIGEIAGEGVMAGVGEGVGRVISGKLAKFGATRMASNADDVATLIKPNTLDGIMDLLALPKGKSKQLIQRYADNRIKVIPEGQAAFETMRRAGDKMITLVEQGDNITNEIFSKGLRDAGIDTNALKVNMVKPMAELDRAIETISRKNLSGNYSNEVNALNMLKNNVSKMIAPDGTISYSSVPDISSQLYEIVANAVDKSGKKTQAGKYLGRPLAALTMAKNQNPVIAGLNREFGPQRRAIKTIQRLGRIGLEEGKFLEGGRTPEAIMKRFGNEAQERNLEAMLNASDLLEKVPEFKKYSFSQDMAGGVLSDILDTAGKNPFTGGRLSYSGLKSGIEKTVIPPLRRAQLLKGLMNSGALTPEILNQPINTWFPQTSALMNLTGISNASAPLTNAVKAPLASALKGVTSPAGKRAILNTVMRQEVKSLNDILYGK